MSCTSTRKARRATSLRRRGARSSFAGRTYHVVATDDGAGLNVYINGNLDASVRAAGPLSYSTTDKVGLTIGGAAASTNRAVFNGAIDDVAIYPTAMPSSAISAHYWGGSPITGDTEVPLSADGFVDSFGVVTHLHYQNSPYDLQFERVKSLLVELGVRHIARLSVYRQLAAVQKAAWKNLPRPVSIVRSGRT